MKFHILTEPPPLSIGESLERFEDRFWYPLGAHSSFRISHGREYLPFFQAMGDAKVLVAEKAGDIQGTIAIVRRTLQVRNSEGRVSSQTANYLCDLKLHPNARCGIVLARLLDYARQQIETGNSISDRACYCVVMEGTGRLPTDYTGRLCVPRFEPVGEIEVLRIAHPNPPELNVAGGTVTGAVTEAAMEQLRGQLAPAGNSTASGNSTHRSIMTPVCLIDSSGSACGTVEDTRRGKRLYSDSGGEMLTAHLSSFAFSTAEAGARLISDALAVSAAASFPALFVAIPRRFLASLLPYLAHFDVLQAPATVFGCGLSIEQDWWIDTAEI